MIALRTVHCPVDFSPATPRQVDLAGDFCRAFNARLVLHHNLQSLGIGASVGWMWNAGHHDGNPQAAAEAKLRECLARVPDGVSVEPLITQGPNSTVVLAVARMVRADLVLVTAHGTMAEDHASITEQMLEDGERAVLVLHEPSQEARTPQFGSKSSEPQAVIAATDLSPRSRAVLEMCIDLTRRLPVELHLLHVRQGASDESQERAIEEKVRNQVRALAPDDVADRVPIHIEYGKPAEGITRLAQRLSAACIVMGEHSRNPLRRWFGQDTPREVLHRAPCPVWYVPAARAS